MSEKRYIEYFRNGAAKQDKTRIKRLNTTCDILAAGKKWAPG